MFQFLKRVQPTKSEEILPRLTGGVPRTQVAAIINGIAETLAKSGLYFSPENLSALGNGPDVIAQLEQMDPAMRTTLLDGTLRPDQQAEFRTFAESVGDLKAAAEAARLAAQLFRLLHDAKTPISGLAPLKRVSDSALRTLRTSAAAVSSGDEATVRMAQQSLAETEELGRELTAMIPPLAAYRSPTSCRLIVAALHALLVAAQSVAEAAARLVLSPRKRTEGFNEIGPLADFQDSRVIRFPSTPHGNSLPHEEVICMPTAAKKR